MDLSPSPALGPNLTAKATAAATTNITLVKGSGARIVGGYLRNRAAAEKYVKIYDKATAPVLASDVPKLTLGIPAAGYIGLGDIVGQYGLKLVNGFGYAITGAYADTDATAVVASDVDVNFIYA